MVPKNPPGTFVIIEDCPVCETGRLVVRHSAKNGEDFVGCSRFPACRHHERYDDRLAKLAARLAELADEVEELRRTDVMEAMR